METTILIYLAMYVFILMTMSWLISRDESKEGFLIANRDRKWWTIAMSKFVGSIGVGYFIAYTGYAYQYGLSMYALLAGLIIGYSVFALWAAPRLYKYSRDKNFYTKGDFVQHTTGSVVAKSIINYISIGILILWLMVGTVGGAKVISYFGLMSYEIALFATVLIVLAYILMAGFRAVLVTDILQAIIILGLMGAITWFITSSTPVNEILAAQTGTLNIPTAIGFFIFGILAVFSQAAFYQLIYAAKDKGEATKGIALAVPPILIVASLLLLIGMYMYVQNPALNAGLIFLEALSQYLPSAYLPAAIVLFFAALMSSADTNIYAITSYFVFTKGSDNPVRSIRYGAILLSLAMMVVGYFFRDLIGITIFALLFASTPSVAMIYLIAGGTSVYKFIGSIVGGLLGLIIGLFAFGVEASAILIVLIGALLGLLVKKTTYFDRRKT